MWIGSSRNNTETPLALKWRKTVKALGVHLSYNNEESVQKNFYKKLEESNPRYACGIGEASPCLVKSQLLRVFHFLK